MYVHAYLRTIECVAGAACASLGVALAHCLERVVLLEESHQQTKEILRGRYVLGPIVFV